MGINGSTAQRTSEFTFTQLSFLFLELHAKRRLKGGQKAPRLPAEIILLVFQFAGLHAVTFASNSNEVQTHGDDADLLNLVLRLPTPPALLPQRAVRGRILTLFRPSCVRVDVSTHDQGWSSYPQDRGKRNSNTWVELAAETWRGSQLAGPVTSSEVGIVCGKRFFVARNLHAIGRYEEQSITFDSDHELLRELGNFLTAQCNVTILKQRHIRLAIYLKSRYPGWACFCRGCSVKVSWELSGYENLLKCLGQEDR